MPPNSIEWINQFTTGLLEGFPGSSDGKESACNVGDLGLIPELERSPGGGHGYPLQYYCPENPHEQRSLVGYSPRGHKELDTIELLSSSSSSRLTGKSSSPSPYLGQAFPSLYVSCALPPSSPISPLALYQEICQSPLKQAWPCDTPPSGDA